METPIFEIRDPIHECITCSEDEKNLINSPLAQSLKWKAQLSMVNQVYNGAVHSRFSHCLGVMKLAGDYMTHLLDTCEHLKGINHKYYIKLARVAGFLHDIGHGPFSHSYDRKIYSKIYNLEDGGHDKARIDLVQSDMLRPYIENCGIKIDDLLKIWNKSDNSLFLIIKNMIEGPLGADRMDFTQRDAYYTGMQHLGTIPAQRLIKNSSIKPENDLCRLTYHSKCIQDIIRVLDGRFNLYEAVYLHKTASAASLLVEKMLEEICDEYDLIEMTKDPEKFQNLYDHTIFSMVISSKSEKAKKYYHQLMNRQLPMMDHEEHVSDFSTPYDESKYREKWYKGVDSEKYAIVKTRPISGISAKKFEQYHIYFHTKFGQIKTCQQLLDEMKYQVPIAPYYIVRGYTFRP